MIPIARNNDFNTSYDDEEDNNRERENDEGTEESIPGLDEFDIRLLNIQASALLVMILGYVLEYISTLQAIEVIKIRQSNNESGFEPDPDIVLLLGSQYEVIAQAVLVHVSKIQYRNTPLHFRIGRVSAARSANFELLLGDIVEMIAYLISLYGVRKLFAINHGGPIYGV